MYNMSDFEKNDNKIQLSNSYFTSFQELVQNLKLEALLLLILVPVIIYIVELINYYNLILNLSIIKNPFSNSPPGK